MKKTQRSVNSHIKVPMVKCTLGQGCSHGTRPVSVRAKARQTVNYYGNSHTDISVFTYLVIHAYYPIAGSID